MISVLGAIIGLMILVAGISFLVKEKDDPQSKQVYTITAVIGAVVTAVAVLSLVL